MQWRTISLYACVPIAALLIGTVATLVTKAADPQVQAPVRSDADYIARAKQLKQTLPGGFTLLIQKPFVIAGDAPPDRVRAAAQNTVQWAVDHLKRDYFDKDPVDLIDIYLFKDKDSYDKYTKELFHDTPTTPYGYYSPAHKALIMNIATGGGTLVHEIVHPFMASNFPKCPSWFNEGLASLYEQSGEKDGHIIGLPNWRLTGLQNALKADARNAGVPPAAPAVPSFKDLCATSTTQFYDDNRGTNYAAARYLLLYLQEKDALRTYYKDFVQNQKEDPTGYATLQKTLATLGDKDMEAFRKKWEAWVLALRYP